MRGLRFSFIFTILASLVGSFVGGVVFSRWLFRGTDNSIRHGPHVTATEPSNPLLHEPLITPPLLRAALDKACENQASRDFFGPGAYNVPRSLWDEAINPTHVPPGQANKTAEEIQTEKGFQKEIEGHRKELESVCGSRDKISDADLMLPLQWLCELARIADQGELDVWEKKFLTNHQLSEDRFNQSYVTVELAIQATPEGDLRREAQCLNMEHADGRSGTPDDSALHGLEDDDARDRLCAAHPDSPDGQGAGQLNWLLTGFAENNNVSTLRAREIMEQAIRDAKAKDPDVTWATFCAGSTYHNDDWRPLDFSVFERTR